MTERFLVTGAMGCLGAWTTHLLLDEGVEVVAFDRSEDRRRLELLIAPADLDEVEFVTGDVADTDTVHDVVTGRGVTHVVHLAALQVPGCREDPILGARVNVLGTTNVFDAVRASDGTVEGLSYASSLAVFGPPERYPSGIATDDARPDPRTSYGVYKVANEGTARVYAGDHGIGSVGLRPAIVYGVGRDQGLTSGATRAMLAAAAGEAFHIPHGGSSIFQHAEDVARLFVRSARRAPDGAEVLNVGGSQVPVAEVVAAITAAAPDSAGMITHADDGLPFPTGIDASGLDRLLGDVSYRPLADGVEATVTAFRGLLERGAVAAPSAS